MQFESFTELWHMAGHGPFVWASYAITLSVIVFLIWLPVQQRKAFITEQKRLQRIAAHEDKSSNNKES